MIGILTTILKSKLIMYKQDWTYCLSVCLSVCLCVWCFLLSETLSWNVLKVAWEVSLLMSLASCSVISLLRWPKKKTPIRAVMNTDL